MLCDCTIILYYALHETCLVHSTAHSSTFCMEKEEKFIRSLILMLLSCSYYYVVVANSIDNFNAETFHFSNIVL